MYQSKNSAVQQQRLAVQRLVLPFRIVGNATAASVQQIVDNNDILFLKTQGVDSITVASGALASGEVATVAASVSDANSVFAMFVRILDDKCKKVVSASVQVRKPDANVAVVPCTLENGSSNGISSLGNIVLSVDLAGPALNAANTLDATLVVEYVLED